MSTRRGVSTHPLHSAGSQLNPAAAQAARYQSQNHGGEALCVLRAELEFLHTTHQELIIDSVPFFKISLEYTSALTEPHQPEPPPLLLTFY